tara:strand:- start:785 stop:1498 length:714 start_codon:yes stop_codon:yes gene_type:complete
MDFKKILESDCALYSIALDEFCVFEFRLLKIKEFNFFNKLINNKIPELVVYDEIFNLCYLGKHEYLPSNLPAGYSISTGRMIYKLSGENEGEEFLLAIAKERTLNPLDSIYEHMRCTVFSGFSSMTPDCIDNMTEKQFIKNFVAAENLLSKTKPGFQRLDLEKIYKELYNIQDEKSKEQEKDTANSESVYINDASMLEKELGYWEMRAAENEFLKEEMSKMNKEKLNKSDLQSLDRR